MLSIFSCACWLSICLLWRNVYLSLLPIFQLGFYCCCCCLMLLSCLYIFGLELFFNWGNANCLCEWQFSFIWRDTGRDNMEKVEKDPSPHTVGMCTSATERKINQLSKKQEGEARWSFRCIVREGLSEEVSFEPSPEKWEEAHCASTMSALDRQHTL